MQELCYYAIAKLLAISPEPPCLPLRTRLSFSNSQAKRHSQRQSNETRPTKSASALGNRRKATTTATPRITTDVVAKPRSRVCKLALEVRVLDFAFAQSQPFGTHKISSKHWPTSEGSAFAGAATRPAWNSTGTYGGRLLSVLPWEVTTSIPSRDDQTWYRRTVSNDFNLDVNGCIVRLPSLRVHAFFLDTLLYLAGLHEECDQAISIALRVNISKLQPCNLPRYLHTCSGLLVVCYEHSR